MMRVGRQNKRVTVEERLETRSATGAVGESWIVVGHAWAEIEPVSKSDEWRNAQAQVRATHKICMRFVDFVNCNCRLKLDDRYLYVSQSKNVGERGRKLELFAYEEATA